MYAHAAPGGHAWAGAQCPQRLWGPAHPIVPPLPLSVKHRHVFKTCGPDGQWVTGPRGQSLRNATQCELDAEDLEAQVGRAGGAAGAGLPALPAPALTCSLPLQEKFAKTYGSFKVMYTVGYSVSLCALLLALALLLGFR